MKIMHIPYQFQVSQDKEGMHSRLLRSSLRRLHGHSSDTNGASLFPEAGKSWLDRILALSVCMHEGQFFGFANQFIGSLTCVGLVTLCVSAIVLWWQRRATGMLGAPVRASGRLGWKLVAILAAFCLYLPMLTASLVLVLLIDKLILPRLPVLHRWLGLRAPA